MHAALMHARGGALFPALLILHGALPAARDPGSPAGRFLMQEETVTAREQLVHNGC